MNFFNKLSLFAFFTVSLCGSALAVPAYPGLIESKQPDGSVVHIRKVGNEHFHYTVSDDGELVAQDTLGYWNYADESGKPTGVRIHKKDKRSDSEVQFLKKRDSKGIIEKFLRERKGKAHRDDSQRRMLPLSSSSGGESSLRPFLAAPATPLANVMKVAKRPDFDQALTQGEIRGLIILVQFSDVKFKSSTPQEDYDRYMNEEGYHENGMRWSVRDYFIYNSSGAFRPYFDVAAPVTLSNTRDFYGSMQMRLSDGSYVDYPDSALVEAVKVIKNRGDVDFRKYDNNSDGMVDFVYMIYAGVGEADTDVSGAIWPQSFWTDPVWISNRLYVSRSACSNEISGTAYKSNRNTNTLAGIGTFVHEFSHVLGLPDFYDTGVNGANNLKTPYVWDLMDMGEYNAYPGSSLPGTAPAHLNAFERYSIGWLTPRLLEKANGEITIQGIEKNDAVLVPTSNPKEYFLLDYRTKYDTLAPLPQNGMLIWRVCYDSLTWLYNSVNIGDDLRFRLYRADENTNVSSFYGALDDPNLKGDPFPGRKNVVEFNKFVTYAGDSLGLRIYDIAETDSAVTFKVKWAGVEDLPSSSSVAESSSSEPVPESSSSEPASSSSAPVPESSSSGELVKAFAVAPAPQVHMSVEGRMLRIVAGLEGEKELRLFDLQGHQLHSERFTGSSATLALERFGHGAFIVRLTSGNRILAVKRLQ